MRSRSSIPYLETRTGELFEDGNEWSKQHGQGKRLLGQLVGARWTLVRPAPVSEVSALLCCGWFAGVPLLEHAVSIQPFRQRSHV